MRAIKVPNGILHVAESKADCPYCTRHISWEEAHDAIQDSGNGFTEIDCHGCGRNIGVTTDIKGDLRSFEPEAKAKTGSNK